MRFQKKTFLVFLFFTLLCSGVKASAPLEQKCDQEEKHSHRSPLLPNETVALPPLSSTTVLTEYSASLDAAAESSAQLAAMAKGGFGLTSAVSSTFGAMGRAAEWAEKHSRGLGVVFNAATWAGWIAKKVTDRESVYETKFLGNEEVEVFDEALFEYDKREAQKSVLTTLREGRDMLAVDRYYAYAHDTVEMRETYRRAGKRFPEYKKYQIDRKYETVEAPMAASDFAPTSADHGTLAGLVGASTLTPFIGIGARKAKEFFYRLADDWSQVPNELAPILPAAAIVAAATMASQAAAATGAAAMAAQHTAMAYGAVPAAFIGAEVASQTVRIAQENLCQVSRLQAQIICQEIELRDLGSEEGAPHDAFNLQEYINDGGGINPDVTPWVLFRDTEYSLAGKLWLAELEARGWKIRTAGAMIGLAIWAVCCYKSWSFLDRKTVIGYLATTPAVALFFAGEMPILFFSKMAAGYLGKGVGFAALGAATATWAYACYGGEDAITANLQTAMVDKANDAGIVATSPSFFAPKGKKGSKLPWWPILLALALLGAIGYGFSGPKKK